MPDSGLMNPSGLEPFITEPGRYAMSDAVYHADPVVDGSLSSTGARLILQSPAKFYYRRCNGSEEKRVFDVGRAAHTLVLGEGAEIVVVKNIGGKNENGPWLTDAAKEAAAEVRAAGKTPLCTEDYYKVTGMAAALRENAEVAKLLAEGIAEESFFAPCPETGVWCRGRADYRHGANRVIDYKTTGGSANPTDFAASMGKWGYHQQGPFYIQILQWLDLVDADCEFWIIAQEKDPPYLCSVVRPDADALAYGAKLNAQALRTYRACVEADEWPGYPCEPVTVALPGWLVAQYEADPELALDGLGVPVVEPLELLRQIREAESRAALVSLVEAHDGSRAWTGEHREEARLHWSRLGA